MESYEAQTLQVMLDAPCNKYSLMSIMNVYGSISEPVFRERLHYMLVDDSGNSALYSPELFYKVREALGIDDLSDYQRGSNDHESVAAALELLHKDWTRRSSKGLGVSKVVIDKESMSYLLTTIMEHPERTADIKRFIDTRDADLSQVDMALLRDYLDTPVPALGDGML
jgi:hypothetical protein